MITKYRQYIIEKFEEIQFPNLIKKLTSKIRLDLINNGNGSFNQKYSFDSLILNIIVDYNKTAKQSYYSNINIYQILSEQDKDIDIKVIVNDQDIDFNYLTSIISHEIRHVYDIFTIASEVEMKSFINSLHLSKFKNTKFNEFINLFYLSLDHELIARNNMLYDSFRWLNITDKNELYKLFQKSYVNSALIQLNDFNSNIFINKFDRKELEQFTKEFSDNIEDNFISVEDFYKKYETIFKSKSNEFLSYIDDMLNDVIYDIINNKTYERFTGYSSYNENINNKTMLN
jgi:hypothetical protein